MLSIFAAIIIIVTGSGCKQSSITGVECGAYVIACGQVQNGIEVVGGVVPADCDCPSNTTFAGRDNVTSGGPWNMCQCK